MTPQLSRRIGRALTEHWVMFDERDRVIRAINVADRWSDLPFNVRELISDIEARPLVLEGFPSEWPSASLTAADRAAARVRVLGPAEQVLAGWEDRIEAATRAALDQVMGLVADRVGRSLTAALVAHLPGQHDQSSHGKGGRVAELPQGPIPSVGAAAKATNPGYGTTTEGPTYRAAGKAGGRWDPDMGPPPAGACEENCTNAVMAFEMRMRGYDVEAAPLDVLDRYGYAGGRTDRQIDDLVTSAWSLPGGKPHGRSFKGQKWRRLSEVDAEIARDWPEGGRGFVNVGKHVFSVTKRNGKAQYVEAQFDATPSRDVTKMYRKKFGAHGGEAKVIRLDDLEPTDGIFEAVR